MSVAIEHAPRARARGAPARAPRSRRSTRVRRTPRGERLPAIESLDELTQLPFTVKDDLREHYPLGLLAVPREQLRRIHASSGTRGTPTVVAYTAGRPRRLVGGDGALHGDGRRQARHGRPQRLRLRAVHRRARLPPGRRAARRARRSRSPAASPRARRCCCATCRARCCAARRPTRCTSPRACARRGSAPTSSRWRSACSAPSRGPRRMREQLEAELGLTALNIYGLSEIVGPGVAAECPEARDGLHVQEDHFLVEVDRPRDRRAGPGRQRRRARVHDADQGGAAAAALPHRRHRER